MASITTKKIFNVATSPANVSAFIELNGSAPVQVFDSTQSGAACYSPNRLAAPTYLVPRLVITTEDKSFAFDSAGGGTIGTVEWLVNEKAIASCGWATSEYAVLTAADSDGRPKGTLRINKNIAANQGFSLRCRLTVADPRNGTNIVAETDPVTLRTNVHSASVYALHTDMPRTFPYNPVTDVLDDAEYEADLAGADKTQIQGLAALKANPLSYLREYAVRLMHGNTQMTSGYHVAVEDITTSTVSLVADTQAAKTSADKVIPAVAIDKVTVDARYVANVKRYRVTAFWGGALAASRTAKKAQSFEITVRRITPTLTFRTVNHSLGGLVNNAVVTSKGDEVEVFCKGRKVRNPDRCITFAWKGRSVKKGGTLGTQVSLGTTSAPTLDLSKVTDYTAANIKSGAVTGLEISVEATLKGPLT